MAFSQGASDAQWLLPQVLRQLVPRLSDGALVYIESPRPLELPAQWEAWRHGRAGDPIAKHRGMRKLPGVKLF